MTFAAREASLDVGLPIFLYAFVLDGVTWRYTSGDRDIYINNVVWSAVPISDDGIRQTGEAGSDALTISAPVSVGPVQVYMQTPPASPILVSILHMHADDPEAIVVYSGEITQVNFTVPGQATLICQTISASMQRDGLRLGWQRTCPYALYDPRTCRVDKSLHAMPLIAVTVDGSVVTFTHPAGGTPWLVFLTKDYNGGFMEWTDSVGAVRRRMIEVQTGYTFTMFGPTDDMHTGLVVVAYPGCRRTMDACVSFNNYLNFGGCKDMPGKSPFDGDPIF